MPWEGGAESEARGRKKRAKTDTMAMRIRWDTGGDMAPAAWGGRGACSWVRAWASGRRAGRRSESCSERREPHQPHAPGRVGHAACSRPSHRVHDAPTAPPVPRGPHISSFLPSPVLRPRPPCLGSVYAAIFLSTMGNTSPHPYMRTGTAATRCGARSALDNPRERRVLSLGT